MMNDGVRCTGAGFSPIRSVQFLTISKKYNSTTNTSEIIQISSYRSSVYHFIGDDIEPGWHVAYRQAFLYGFMTSKWYRDRKR